MVMTSRNQGPSKVSRWVWIVAGIGVVVVMGAGIILSGGDKPKEVKRPEPARPTTKQESVPSPPKPYDVHDWRSLGEEKVLQEVLTYPKGYGYETERPVMGSTRLHSAASCKFLRVVKALIERGADLNAQDNRGGTALGIGVVSSQKELVALLVSKGADVNVADKNKFTPLFLAVERRDLESAKLMLEHGAVVDAKACSPYWKTAFSHAVETGQKDMAELLLKNGASVDQEFCRPTRALYCTMERKREDMTLMLLKYGAAPKADKNGSPLTWAVRYNQAETVKALLDGGVSLKDEGKRALFEAVDVNNAALLELLLERGADVKTKENHEETLLHRAAYYCDEKPMEKVCELLLAKGADVNARDDRGQTPILTIVLKPGAYENGKDVRLEAKRRVLQLLLDKGADINAKDNGGDTALHCAVFGKHEEMAEFLKQHGAK